MKNLIRLTDYNKEDIFKIFEIADEVKLGKYADFLKGKTVIMFFPNTSIRTRVTFEKGIYLLGGQSILFPPDTLDKKEAVEDVMGYLNQWADVIVVRHKDIHLLEKMSQYSKVPVINALTDVNHPCEMLSDLYALSKIRDNFLEDKYLFCGANGNIGLAWREAARTLGFELTQCCPKGYEMPDIPVTHDMRQAVVGKDIVCTDSIPKEILPDFEGYQITKEIMGLANKGAVLNTCPPFYRGEEVSEDAIASEYFVGYEFKKCLLEVQQAIIIYSLMH